MALINTAQLYIKIDINEKTGNTIIDFGTTENFIIRKYIGKKILYTKEKIII